MLKVALVGCGKIADTHVSQIVRVRGCEVVGVCDKELLMARQLGERFGIKACFDDLSELLHKTQPDVVHVTTPAETHFDIASFCMEAGCHIYVEKPFTLTAGETEALIALAQERRRRVTVGHDDQFSHVSRRMRQLIATGYIGDFPVHMESTFCYDLSDPAYARALLLDKQHWVRKLPGKLLQNVMSHGVARIAEFLTGTCEVIAYGFTSPFLKSMGETDLLDEARIIINDERGATAYFTFSSQMRPQLHEFRIFGNKNGLILDQDHEVLIKLSGERMKSYAEKFIPPFQMASQRIREVADNAKRFALRDFHLKAGMKNLIESFYNSIVHDEPVPIPYREIILTARIMDSTFTQLASKPRACEAAGAQTAR